MNSEFSKLLHGAEGQSRRVVVVFLDVRGFSSFAGIAESTDTAEFLRSVYLKILDEHFDDAAFSKPTGDGLLILLSYSRENLEQVVRSAVDRSLHIVETFASFCEGDPMINFDVPTKLGIGLARGSATALTASDQVLDYSGRPLNLASRLMDLARPSGIVFDDRFGLELLETDVQTRFARDFAYVKGLAESTPMTVYCLEGYTEIPEYNKVPLDGFERFAERVEHVTFKDFEDRGRFRNFRHFMSREPARRDNIELHISYPKTQPNGTKHPSMTTVDTLPGEFGTTADQIFALVEYPQLVAEMREEGVKSSWGVSATLEYSIVPESSAGDQGAD